ncbi:MAG TPA: hypothetical protein VF310_06520, partial [Vicinamibacteria bacterium]
MATLDVPARTRRTREVAATARAGANLILLALALLLAARALYYFSTTRALIAWPFEILPGEGTMLHESRLLNAGPVGGLRALYGPQTPDRFLAGNYPPLFLALWALKPGPPGLPGGRVLSLLASFAAAVAGGAAAYAAARGPRGLRVGTG